MQLEGTLGQRLGAYTAELGTPDHDAMLSCSTWPHRTPSPHTGTTSQAVLPADTSGATPLRVRLAP
ncbi:hypothetical protein AB0O67_32305 [Streptomyces sp. NPDC086077]|uniref:hypothetical protein n=1 Tax=Streptomyces sp. NPDC086077 TaxID=3154862 RepID=UPI00342331E4